MAKETHYKEMDMMELYPEGYQFNLSDFALFLSVMKEKKHIKMYLALF